MVQCSALEEMIYLSQLSNKDQLFVCMAGFGGKMACFLFNVLVSWFVYSFYSGFIAVYTVDLLNPD